MPTPHFTLRLPVETTNNLAEMAKIYGAPNMRAFAAEILGVMCSGDLERVKAFNTRLIMKTGEQLTLKLNAAMDEAAAPLLKDKKPALKAKTTAKKGKAKA